MVDATLSTDYLVVGAGAMGMAFTDALVAHSDVHVTLVDRRHTAGGHWLDAYPFVQLHQASVFYGVASTVLGTGAVQQGGPERGLGERARQSEIVAYFDDVVRRLVASGQVTFLPTSDHHCADGTQLVTSRVSGRTCSIDVRRRVVDATYSAPTIPATTAAPFTVADDVPVIPVGELARLSDTDAIVWLLGHDVDPDRIMWVRPREPWMLNRSVVQPETIERVVRLGHIRAVTAHEIVLERGSVNLPPDSVVVHCAASGLRYRHSFRSSAPTGSDCNRSGPASRASTRPSPAMSRPPATTTANATGCVRRIGCPTTRVTGFTCSHAAASPAGPSPPKPISPRGPTDAR
ncbi:NAD(P)-binding protein [Gordonia tangerina]|uniref:NAD(P)/FAD-dependent oxidoreductase n=1 Tax=Gordonia tangerina TaxID=2911060 RepID=A0ABS9DPT0_9ACTN|nr:FAD/NAD(P)-binding protein [Gordonia tangerina]MCF3941230.1 NAD(P)/FAD-dependent oxidoreductase [Gordonia tangerina]